MATDVREIVALDDSFARELPELAQPWRGATVPAPELLALDDGVAAELGLDVSGLRQPGGLAVLVGNAVPEGATPVALVYAGHQFGGYSPRLGDGRALLVGEVVDGRGRRWDLHLKGSGPTPFARGGDGKAAVGPMLREYVVSAAMHALGIPTTRALAVVATGEEVVRDTMLPGAVLARVAASHIRVGTFEYAARHPEPTVVRRLADHSIRRHHPQAADADEPYHAFLGAVVEAQASLVARWMLVGFIHGVMNTDNMTISGETIDYGPCAFMDRYDPATVFSSIDHAGRYAYGNQPLIAQWNLARLAEALLPLLADEEDTAVAKAMEVLRSFGDRYERHWHAGMLAKLGIVDSRPGDDELVTELLARLQAHGADLTSTFRALSTWLAGRGEAAQLDGWTERWRERVLADGRSPETVAAAMDAVNPVYIPRNHLVEEALAAATAGDLAPFHQLVDVVTRPFEERPGFDRYAQPSPTGSAGYQTFCGT